MFLIRSAFWITVVLLLLPTDDKPAQKSAQATAKPQTISTSQALGAARETLGDISGFCERNPSVCSASGAAFDVLQRKAKYAVRMIYNWANSDPATQHQKPQQSAMILNNIVGFKQAKSKPMALVRVSENVSPAKAHIVRPRPRPKRPTSQNTLQIQDLVPTWVGPRISLGTKKTTLA